MNRERISELFIEPISRCFKNDKKTETSEKTKLLKKHARTLQCIRSTLLSWIDVTVTWEIMAACLSVVIPRNSRNFGWDYLLLSLYSQEEAPGLCETWKLTHEFQPVCKVLELVRSEAG